MEFKIIEGRTFEQLKKSLADLLMRSNKLNPPVIKDEWWDNQDVCRLLGISLRTLQSYRDKGLLPYSQIGHKCYYKIEDIERFIEENKVSGITNTHKR